MYHLRQNTKYLPGLLIAVGLTVCLLFTACSNTAPIVTAPAGINEVNGCPEVPGLNWGITTAEAMELREWDTTTEETLTLSQAQLPFGLPQADISAYFEDDALTTVTLMFPSSRYDHMVISYYEIYGDTGMELLYDPTARIWYGDTTSVHITENRDQVLVTYSPTPVAKQKIFMATIDPLHFLDDPPLLGSDLQSFLNSHFLHEGEDYIIANLTDPLVSAVKAYRITGLDFNYLGYSSDYTFLEIDREDDSAPIDNFGYCVLTFSYNTEALADKLKGLMEELDAAFNQSYLSWVSTIYGDDIQQITRDEFLNRIAAGQQDYYNMSWPAEEMVVSITAIINNDEDYIVLSVSFSSSASSLQDLKFLLGME